MGTQGATTPRGKILTDEQGKPIRLETGEATAQAIGFRPERIGRISSEHRSMQNVKAYFNDKRDDLPNGEGMSLVAFAGKAAGHLVSGQAPDR